MRALPTSFLLLLVRCSPLFDRLGRPLKDPGRMRQSGAVCLCPPMCRALLAIALACSPDECSCESQPRQSEGEGNGPALSHWCRRIAKATCANCNADDDQFATACNRQMFATALAACCPFTALVCHPMTKPLELESGFGNRGR